MDETIPQAVMAAATPPFDNTSAWHNFTLWTTQHLKMSMNMSRLAPSLEDLVLAGPRMVMKLGRLGSFISYPDAVDNFGQRTMPDPTDAGVFTSTFSSSTGSLSKMLDDAASLLPSPTTAAEAAASAAAEDPTASVSRFSMEGARGIGSVLSYATSKWAITCIAMAILINRTHIFAATRRRLRLTWHIRMLLRLPPAILLLWQARRLLQSIQCQTSPDFAQLRWGDPTKSFDVMFSEANSFFHGLSSALLFGASDEESCRSVRMVPWDDQEQPELVGSLSRLWPLFLTFCLSQFVEVLSCTVQGRPVGSETGTTLFEHSLAFAEADAAISSQLGWGLFANASKAAADATVGTKIAVTRAMIMKRVNTPPEVLLVTFLSTMSYFTSHILGMLNLQPKLRLISTGFYGLCFMGCIGWSTYKFSVDDPTSQGLLRYPTVYIIGIIPHTLILTGIISCAVIYLVALTLSALAVPEANGETEQLTFKQRFLRAHANMQANVSLSEIRIRMDMDFYTALVRAGFGAITMASEAVYLNEDHRVNLKRYTWLEEERFREIEDLKMQWIGGVPGSRFDTVGTIGLVPVKPGQPAVNNGYAREKAAQQVSKKDNTGRRARDGVGAAERSSRWLMALDYMMHITRLIVVTWALCTVRFLKVIGWGNPPRWLRGLSERPKKPDSSQPKKSRSRQAGNGTHADVLSPGSGGYFTIPRDDQVDVEELLRSRMDDRNETEVDTKLYSYFLRDGWWGNKDTSGDYVPSHPLIAGRDDEPDINDPDFDTTSIISTTETSTESEFGWETDRENDWLDDGQRTPTQRNPGTDLDSSRLTSALQRARTSRESSPVLDTPIATADLARLLHPQSAEDREEAQRLAAHLSANTIMTRSRFKQQLQRQRAQLLLSNPNRSPALEKMTPEEEERQLEQLLLARRAEARGKDGQSWKEGAAGLGSEGPQCVVCQCAPRTIIVWPCRCLGYCDDCRVSLAMNNYDKCVCCRREVSSFSRIYVP
ncbi:hypothetical protein QBC40DRAFT_272050 [Triangularia verruculosa]|uniref:Uncharacterized protein n=1 Tax=Triangularia verruculosa TaxID=2587418 RepID=A0AAN6XSZ2_9PEZI|nr:hypothetical protein QBC40DRAFT_272050 [Triangularia verruculosa]